MASDSPPLKSGDDANSNHTEDDLIKDGKNARLVLCQFCKSKILDAGKATFVLKEHFVPFVGSSDSADGETIPKFWQVDDMFTFENVGFSNTVGNTKYLACGNCEIGPIGTHDITSKISYVALSRVNYG